MTGEQLRTWRRERGLLQRELASMLGVSVNTLARWERGALRIRHPESIQLALQALNHRTPSPPPKGPHPEAVDQAKPD